MKCRDYVILGIHKETVEVVGLIEKGIGMTISDTHTRVWRMAKEAWRIGFRHKQFLHLRTYAKDCAKRWPEYEWAVFKAGTKTCPVKINWGEYFAEVNSDAGITDKRKHQNLPFTSKMDGVF